MNNNLPEITFRNMIVHTVDHKHSQQPILSDLESPIDDEVGNFIRQHIILNREHNRARKALFINAPNRFSELCDEILSNSSVFVDCSKDMARLLFQAMVVGGRKIDPGDLVVCVYGEDGSEIQHLALLKMEPRDGFAGKRETLNGQTRVILQRVKGVLPTSELQKCAFILPAGLRQERRYDLIVLDQQAARYGVRRPVASFFQTGFLQCKSGLYPKEQTQIFLLHSQAWIESHKANISSQEVERFKQRTTEVVQSNLVDVTAMASELLDDTSLQDNYLDYMQKKGLDSFTFVPDPQERDKWINYKCFQGDQGLQVRIRADAVGNGRILSWVYDEATNTHNVTIRTINWEEVLKRTR